MVTVRRYRPGEEKELVELFRQTVHRVNSKDYSPSQINAWAPDNLDIDSACQRIRRNNPFVAVYEGRIVGYADIQPDGYIDQFFCHHEYTGLGIGKKLFAELEKFAVENDIKRMHANVSTTARPFFESLGFVVQREQVIHLRGQSLTNFHMSSER